MSGRAGLELNDDQEAFRDSIRQMARKEITPIAAQMDQTDEYPMHILELFRDLGLVQLAVPAEHGGPGADITSICIAREEIARAGSMALATLAGQNNTLTLALRQLGTEEQCDRFMPELARGAVALVALTEPDSGGQLGKISTRARRDGSSWVINGYKSLISWGKLATYAVVLARTNDTPGARGISSFIVPTDSPGFIEARRNDKMGQRGFPNVDLAFEDVRVPDGNLLGGEGKGVAAALHGLHQNRTMMAAIALGGGHAALDYAIHFLKNRQYKDQPMSDLQGLRWMIGDMSMRLDASRAMVYDAAARLDAGSPVSGLVRLTATAKAYTTESALKVCNDALQLLGGAGYMKDHPVERYVRDVRTTTIYEGTTQVLLNAIAADLVDVS